MPILSLKPKTILNDRNEIEEMLRHEVGVNEKRGNTYRAYDRTKYIEGGELLSSIDPNWAKTLGKSSINNKPNGE